MYDPEFNIWIDELLKQSYTITDIIRNRMGENHLLTKLCESFDDALGIIEKMRSDYDNCFDESERKIMEKDIRKAINEVTDLWEQVVKIYESQGEYE